ncbi:glycosyltransferase [Actinomyces sp. zg-332]|uniref:glycosyltransferase n=1 Tax=Actinomyces sp. zg-332 TaxID=2708340 RepID=UPI00142192E9|nr:glycosyltransferase [Actinomyces sp. zg-332]QPK94330.1 glycosyltransferase [Actinomyces sp. zg-332]
MYKVSVIIPVYNSEKFLAQCLDSVVTQSLSDIQIICINDGSTDKSADILDNYTRNYPNVSVITQENEGPSSRNKAIDKAEGKYIYFLDSDDIITVNALEKLYEICEQKELDILFFSADTFFEQNKLKKTHIDFKGRYLRQGKYQEVKSGVDLLVELISNKKADGASSDYIVSACLMFVRADLLNTHNIRFMSGVYHEDNLFCFACLMKAEKAYCVNDIFYFRRIRSGSIMTNDETHINLLGYYKCFINQYDIAYDKKLRLQQQEAVQEILSVLCFHISRIYKLLDVSEREKFLDKLTKKEKYFFTTFFEANVLFELEIREKFSRENAILRAELKEIDDNIFFRIGRVITFPMRKLRTTVKVLKTRGISGIVQVIVYKFKR